MQMVTTRNNALFWTVMDRCNNVSFMKSLLPLLLLFIASLIACEKETSSSSNTTVEGDKPCLKGKFIANACNGLAIVQVVEPLLDTLKSSVYLDNAGEGTEYVFVTELPKAYRDGDPFYFILESSFTTYLHDQACSWPKFGAAISGPSRFECGITKD
jgi:hypothetical protein